MPRQISHPWLLILLVVLAGCGGSAGVPVHGTVTVDGQPIDQGVISFVAHEPGARSEGAVITGGRFTATVLPGVKRVEIRASRPKPPDKNDPDAGGLREDYIPARYNLETTLSAEISPDRENELCFELMTR